MRMNRQRGDATPKSGKPEIGNSGNPKNDDFGTPETPERGPKNTYDTQKSLQIIANSGCEFPEGILGSNRSIL